MRQYFKSRDTKSDLEKNIIGVNDGNADLIAVGAAAASAKEGDGAVETDLPIFGKVTLPKTFWKVIMWGICLVWSTNFAVIKQTFDALPDGILDPSLYVAIRFTIAALLMAPGAWGHFKNFELMRNGFWVGLCVFTGYIGQSIGIMSSTANKTAFFCSLNVVWVAMVSGLLTGKFQPRTWIAILLAITGAGFIELNGFVLPEATDLWLLLQPLGFGTGYIVLQENMKKFPDSAGPITAFKLLSVALLTLGWAFMEGHTFSDVIPIFQNRVAITSILYTSVITTALAIWVQSIAFKNVAATEASLILTSEPIWAAAFATFLIGEVITPNDYIGGSLIIAGCIYNEVDVVTFFRNWIAKKNDSSDTSINKIKK